MKPPIDFKGVTGKLLRGNNIYPGGTTSPNPTGRNQHMTMANAYLKRKKLLAKKALKK